MIEGVKVCPACSREYDDAQATCQHDGAVLVHLDGGGSSRVADLVGQVVDGRYHIEHIVGRGGMGTVYACRHIVVGKTFAIKVLRSGIERSEEVLQRFTREAQAANAIRSRHICQMSDFGQLDNGAFYVVMELLDGESLTRALRHKRLTRRDIKHVFIQIAETLQKAHDAHIIHRDLKPDNVVLIEEEGDPFFVKLVDFGIAKIIESKAHDLTETGVILGTPYYMSPEQARGDDLDHRSDIYALGVMIYRAFTGKLPFMANTTMGVLTRHLTEQPELPSNIASIDAKTERLIMRCLEKRPIDRFQSMAALADALRSLDDVAREHNASLETMDDRSNVPVPAFQNIPTPTRVDAPGARSGRIESASGNIRSKSEIPPPLPAPEASGKPQVSTQAPSLGPAAAIPTPAAMPTPGAMPAPMPTPGAMPAPMPTPGAMPAPMPTAGAAPQTAGSFTPQYATGPQHNFDSIPPNLQAESLTDRSLTSSRWTTNGRGHHRKRRLAPLAVFILSTCGIVAAMAWLSGGANVAAPEVGEAASPGLTASPSTKQPQITSASAAASGEANKPVATASASATTATATPPEPGPPKPRKAKGSRPASRNQKPPGPPASPPAPTTPPASKPTATPPTVLPSPEPLDDLRSPFD